LALALSFASRSLFAQSSEDRASAQALFDDGRALVQANRAAEACPKFEESQRLDPGTGTLLNLANCYERVGRTASAWALYVEVISASRSAGRTDREALAKEHADALLPRLPRLSIDVPVQAQVAGLVITRDGQPVRQAQWGSALPIDPGKHQLAASAPGKKPWQFELQIDKPGQTEALKVPALVDAPAEAPLEPNAGKPSPDEQAQAARRAKLRGAAYISGGLGVVGIAVGSYFGLSALSKNSASKADCTGNDCTSAGYSERNGARNAGTVSTIAFIAGGVALGAGVVLFLSSNGNQEPSGAALHVSASAAPGAAWLSLGGAL
jgi:hypothetical protein